MIMGITALRFNLDDPKTKAQTFIIAVNNNREEQPDRTADRDTVLWWANQPDVDEVFNRRGVMLSTALTEFSKFYTGALNFWSMGYGLEHAIMKNAYAEFAYTAPWQFWELADGRTFLNVAAWLSNSCPDLDERRDSTLTTAHNRMASLHRASATISARKAPHPHARLA